MTRPPRHYPQAKRPAPLPDADCAVCGEEIVASRSVNDDIAWCHSDVPAVGHRARPVEVGKSPRPDISVSASQRAAAVAAFDTANTGGGSETGGNVMAKPGDDARRDDLLAEWLWSQYSGRTGEWARVPQRDRAYWFGAAATARSLAEQRGGDRGDDPPTQRTGVFVHDFTCTHDPCRCIGEVPQ